MRFVDEVKIFVHSGDGGKGCVSFRREKFVPRGGPNGGDGGNGSSIVLVANSKRLNLIDLKYHSHFRGKHGVHGMGSDKHGKNAEDTIISVPPGTIIKDLETGEVLADLTEPDQSWVAAKGGQGGRGNARFATATNRAPRNADPGRPGRERWLLVELKVIADVGIVGFPSVGKSTLIRALSNAKPKVAAYPFTTLSPHLGTIMTDESRQVVFADIPGLIRGAHEGQGLGHQFLRHIERTRILVHMVDLDPHSGRDPWDDFTHINEELEAFDPELIRKPQIVAANKIDLPGADQRLKDFIKDAKKAKIEVIAICAMTGDNTDHLLNKVLIRLDELDGRTPGELTWEGP